MFVLVTSVLCAAPASVEAGAVAATPIALGSGLAQGVTIGAAADVAPWLRWSASVEITSATEENLSWRLRHRQVHARLGVAAFFVADGGELSLALQLGVAAVQQRAHRLDRARVKLIYPEAAERDSWALGPQGAVVAQARVEVLPALSLLICGGRSLAWIQVNDRQRWRRGWLGIVGASYAF